MRTFVSAALLGLVLLLDSYDAAMAQTGSFARTCQRCYRSGGGTITCLCQRINGSWTWTSINYTRCPGWSLTNINGRLVCGP